MIEETIQANTAAILELTELLKASRTSNIAEVKETKEETPAPKPAKKKAAPKKKKEKKEPEPEVEERPKIETLDGLRDFIRTKRVALRKAGDADGLKDFSEGFAKIKEENCYDKLNDIPADELPEFIADTLDLFAK